MVFCCHSWLLFPKNREILPETLNMVDFIGDFYIYDSEEYDVFHDKWRVFAKDFEKPNSELPEDTTQRRCLKKKWLLTAKDRRGRGHLHLRRREVHQISKFAGYFAKKPALLCAKKA